MNPRAAERLRLLLIGSTVMSSALILIFGIPRARAWLTPRMERVWVVSAALGDSVAGVGPREVLQGTPVTLYALIETRSGDESVFYGTVDRARLAPDAEPVNVETWNDWWMQPEFLWFKVEPAYPFANPDFAASFAPEQIEYTDNYQVNWGFGWSHAADIRPGGDAYPEWATGTMRFSARAVIRDGRDRIIRQVEAPGAAAVHVHDPDLRPHRVSVRGGDDAFGRVGAFAGLPYVPTVGAAPAGGHPTERYLGGTVLDFWLLAQRLAGGYAGNLIAWEQLPEVASVVVDDMFLGNDGHYYWSSDPRRQVTFADVQLGDLLAIDDHVGVVYEDRGPGGAGDGILNRWDRLLEAYFEPLRDTAAGDAFVADITIYRLQPTSDGS